MAAIQMMSGAEFHPEEFRRFLQAQNDMGTKWAPTFVRVVAELPRLGNNKLDKHALRREKWMTADPTWWQPDRNGPYEALTPSVAESLNAALPATRRAL
jgi:fatty-acyl-CoA synthase